jgi:hypothetical protein
MKNKKTMKRVLEKKEFENPELIMRRIIFFLLYWFNILSNTKRTYYRHLKLNNEDFHN